MNYLNRSILQGKVVSTPTTKQLNPRTKITSFSLLTVESWLNDEGQPREHRNFVTVEVVGRDAERISKTPLNSYVTVEGYIRSDEIKGVHAVRVRTLTISVWGPEWTNVTSPSS